MAVIVTMHREPFKRYQVVEEDEHLFDGIDGWVDVDLDGWAFYSFGAQAVRPSGIDEAYRVLSTRNVLKVARR